MDAAEQTRSFPVLVVYWFLAAVALAFAVMALLEVNRLRTRLPFQLRVLDRTLQLEVREISRRRGKYKALYAVVDLRLERLDTRQVVNTTEERRVSKDEMVMHSFLDRWERGAALTAMERDGKLDLDAPPAWLPALGLSIGMCMFGAFAWIVKPFAEGGRGSGMGIKFLVLALFPLGAAAWGIATEQRSVTISVAIVARKYASRSDSARYYPHGYFGTNDRPDASESGAGPSRFLRELVPSLSILAAATIGSRCAASGSPDDDHCRLDRHEPVGMDSVYEEDRRESHTSFRSRRLEWTRRPGLFPLCDPDYDRA